MPKGEVRAFCAFDMPIELRERLGRETAALQRELPNARWVRPESLHLTIKFLGEQAPARLERLASAIAGEIAACPPVTFRLRGSGFFPNARRPRVAWIGGAAEGAEPVVEIVERGAAAEGIERERRRWALHLTLARLKAPWPPQAVETFLEWGRRFEAEPFRAAELILFMSRLQPGGAVYTPLHRLPLEGAVSSRGADEVR